MANPRDRNQRMKSLFANVNADDLAKAVTPSPADAEKRRVGSVAVKSMDRAFVSIEDENRRLHDQLLSAESIVEIDPDNVVPSFISDRLDIEGDRAFDAFVEGIREAGQKLPILVRPLPGRPGHYQAAYGHRRLRACQILKRPIKAVVKDLSDEELIISQGIENAARLNLSFIEQALFALKLKERGYSRETISEALGRKEQKNVAYISFLTNAAAALPEDLIRRIGTAPSVGRPKWEKLGSLIRGRSLTRTQHETIEALSSKDAWTAADSNQRFALVLEALDDGARPEPGLSEVSLDDGSVVVAKRSANATTLILPEKRIPGLSAWLMERLPDLVREFRAGKKEGQSQDDP